MSILKKRRSICHGPLVSTNQEVSTNPIQSKEKGRKRKKKKEKERKRKKKKEKERKKMEKKRKKE